MPGGYRLRHPRERLRQIASFLRLCIMFWAWAWIPPSLVRIAYRVNLTLAFHGSKQGLHIAWRYRIQNLTQIFEFATVRLVFLDVI